ncbi:MAG: MBL fold metallo-hydrolase [Chloroflexi bacterium]|nr:MBL fold metallo-hydrolase [Chloroflexota bacterium]
MLNLSFYGGANEIGGNKILLEAEATRVFLDFGTSYSSEELYFEFPMLRPACIDDLLKTNVLPRLPGLYKGAGFSVTYGDDGTPSVCGQEERCLVHGVLLSHAHMDHYGYLGMLRPDIPVYLSPVSKRLIELRNDIREEWLTQVDMDVLQTVERGEEFQVGHLAVRRFDVDHSILGASAYLIRAGDRVIAYSGDLRLHGNSPADTEEFIRACRQAKVDVLLCEGTRVGPVPEDEKEAESHVLSSEAEVEERCRDILSRENGLVIYDASPADMNRMRIVCRVAAEFGRMPVFDSKKAYLLIYLNYPDVLYADLPSVGDFKVLLSRLRLRTSLYGKYGVPPDCYVETYTDYRRAHEAKLLVAQRPVGRGDKDLLRLPDDVFVWGPLREAVLKEPGRYLLYTSSGPHTMLHFLPPDGKKMHGTYIYGKAEPFKEEMELSFERLEHWINLCGLKIEYAHTSGHMHHNDVKRFIAEVDPGVLVPIHTQQADLFRPWARDVRIPVRGQTLQL